MQRGVSCIRKNLNPHGSTRYLLTYTRLQPTNRMPSHVLNSNRVATPARPKNIFSDRRPRRAGCRWRPGFRRTPARWYKTYEVRAIPRRGSPMCACTHGTALGRGYGAHTQGEHGEVYFDAGSSSQDGLGLGRILPGAEGADVPSGMDDKACGFIHPSGTAPSSAL